MTWDNEISHDEADAILSGSIGSPAAGDLAGVLEEIRRDADTDQSAFIASFARIVAAEAATTVVAPLIASPSARADNSLIVVPMRRIAATATSAILIVASLAGVAVAADHSSPGEILYGLDRALEAFGIGSGGDAERLEEVRVLIDAGEIENGLSHATETLNSRPANQAAHDAIADATVRMEQTPDNASSETRAKVRSLLNYLADNSRDLDPSHIASLARAIAPEIVTPARDTPPSNPQADLQGSETGRQNRTDNPSSSRPTRP